MPPVVGMVRQGVEALFARRPAVPLAVALVLGVACESVAPTWPVAWLVMGGLLVAVAALRFRQPVACSSALLAAAFLIGLTAAQLESSYFSDHQIALFTTDEPRLAQLELKVTSPPRLIAPVMQGRPMPPKQVARASVVRVRTVAGWQDATGDVTLTVDQPHPGLADGQTVRVTGTLQRPAVATNPGQFDWAVYYRREGVLAGVSVPHADALTILSEPRLHAIERLRADTRHLLAQGFPAARSRDHALLQALVLGDREIEMRDAQDDFARSGTAHLLAVSGLHVVLVGATALLICRLLCVHPRRATVLSMAVVLLYGLAVVPATPAIRATVLCLAYGVSQLSRRSRDGLQLLALCAVGLLIYHPHDLSSAGFQLSFLTVAGMILAGRHVAAFITDCIEDEHARVARSFRPPGFWGALWLRFRGALIDAVALSIVAWLVSLPLVMFHFDQVNPWATVAGIVLFPLVALGLVGGLFKVALTLALPSLSAAWASMAAAPMVWLRHAVHGLAALPGADLPAATVSPWLVAAAYALLCLPLLPWAWPLLRRAARCAPAAACVIVMLPARVGATGANDPAADVRVTLLSIGAGQVGVIEMPDHHVVLIDDGSSSVADPLHKCLEPYLRSRGVREVETIFLSHPDFDHISAAADTAEAFHVKHVVVNPMFRQQSRGNEPAEAMLARLDEDHIPVEVTSRGQTIPLDGETSLQVLWPPPGRPIASTNNAGLVLRLTSRGRTVLFPADIQTPTEWELLQHPDELRADVLVAPHHGSAEVSTADFLAAVHPAYVLSSNDHRLSRKQREFDDIAAKLPLYRTSRYGAVTVHIGKDGAVRVETFLHPAK